jgi:two-component system, OmpR family, sensor kinase
MALRELLRTRLALRIYLVGLAQIAVVAAGLFVFVQLNRPRAPDEQARLEDAVATRALGLLADRAGLQRELERATEEIHAAIAVVSPEGEIIATTMPADETRCHHAPPPPGGPPPHEPPFVALGPPPGRRGPICRIAAMPFPSGELGTIEFRLLPGVREPPLPLGLPIIGFVLITVGVSSWLLGRSLARPLKKLSTAASALGEGDLGARADLGRSDELGEVARAFDEMAERVADLLRAEKELVANVSHELRTPLARIRVALDLAAEGDAEVARESLADIRDDLDELERLVSDVLAAARLDLGAHSGPRGVPPLRRELLDVAGLVGQAAARFEAAHPARPLVVRVPGEPLTVDGDPVLLRRVLDNLLENAHRYGKGADDPVEVVARADRDELVLEVVDEGIGISAEDLERVFMPFFRADKSRARATGGLGLGLALVKRIVEAHGGTIAIDSAPGEGTRARVRLPRVHED